MIYPYKYMRRVEKIIKNELWESRVVSRQFWSYCLHVLSEFVNSEVSMLTKNFPGSRRGVPYVHLSRDCLYIFITIPQAKHVC